GEEFGYVLSGSITIHLGKQSWRAKKGESFYFTPRSTHYISASPKSGACLIWVSSPPSF
ncbi:MAG: cupin domain-containing protein, partial [Eisenbergiella sp.]